MGRTAYLGMLASPGKADEKIALEALETMGIGHLAERIFLELSGGERQMALIARALAQQTQILVMDEPTSNLDFGNQIRVLKHINNLAQKGYTIVMTSHFPNHAFLCSTKVALIKTNSSCQVGGSDELITELNLHEVYGVDVKITKVEGADGKTIKACVPMMN